MQNLPQNAVSANLNAVRSQFLQVMHKRNNPKEYISSKMPNLQPKNHLRVRSEQTARISPQTKLRNSLQNQTQRARIQKRHKHSRFVNHVNNKNNSNNTRPCFASLCHSIASQTCKMFSYNSFENNKN